mmetsp:Transcript_15206/g.48637  ORF Transcript_15206/g.48637 Transcript_15206/m.48637 type:complete len:144 (+) Transcript_15206:1-432(+)
MNYPSSCIGAPTGGGAGGASAGGGGASASSGGAGDKSGSVMYLAPDLGVTPDEGRAQLWHALPRDSEYGMLPGEVALHIRAHGSDKMLCSDETQRSVYLLRPQDAALLHRGTGTHIFNDAWEATPDVEPPADVLRGLLEKLVQ